VRFGLRSPKTEKMVHLLSTKIKGNTPMKNEVVKIFDDLDNYLDFCRFELRDYNPADLYNRESQSWRDFEYSRRPKKPWNGERKPYLGKNPRPHNPNFNNKPRFRD